MQRNYFSFTKTFFVLIAGFCMQQGLAQDAMFIAPNGNVGIGTTSPRGALDISVSKDIYLVNDIDKGSTKNLYIPGQVYMAPFGGGDNNSYFYVGGPNTAGSSSLFILTRNEGKFVESLFLQSNGNVGIGTTSPTNKLSVEGNASFTGYTSFKGGVIIENSSTLQSMLTVKGNTTKASQHYGSSFTYYTDNNTSRINGGLGTREELTISIHAESNIIASGFYAFSDSRIKTDFNRSDIAADLATLKQIQVTDYRYKDPFQYGNAVKKGIIAQEVEAVFPQAVNKHTDYITDIFAMPKEVSLNEKTLTVSMEKAHGLANGDMLRLITPTEVVETAVEVLDNNTFMVKDWTKDSKEVFVYGKKVDDFRAVDFDRLTILSISSIQQLCKEMEAMKNELSTCQKALLTLKDLEARVGKMEISAKPATATIE